MTYGIDNRFEQHWNVCLIFWICISHDIFNLYDKLVTVVIMNMSFSCSSKPPVTAPVCCHSIMKAFILVSLETSAICRCCLACCILWTRCRLSYVGLVVSGSLCFNLHTLIRTANLNISVIYIFQILYWMLLLITAAPKKESWLVVLCWHIPYLVTLYLWASLYPDNAVSATCSAGWICVTKHFHLRWPVGNEKLSYVKNAVRISYSLSCISQDLWFVWDGG